MAGIATVIDVLMAEDSPSDAALARASLEDAKLDVHLHTVADGEEALRFLRRERGFATAPRPDLVLLDLQMPRKGGYEVLAEIRADPDLSALRVFLLISNGSEEEARRRSGGRADGYAAKPVDLGGLVERLRTCDGRRRR